MTDSGVLPPDSAGPVTFVPSASDAVTPVAGGSERPPARPRSMFRLGLAVFVQNRLAVVGLLVLVLAVLFAWVGPLVWHSNQVFTDLGNADLPPGGAHPLGTDGVGYDELGRLMVGGQTSLLVGFASAVIATVIGTLYGAVAGFLGGAVDAVMMRVVDALLAIPVLFLLLFLVTIVEPSLWILVLVLGFTGWLIPARLVRGESLTLRVREYVQAVRVMGGSSARSVLRHIIPNTAGTVIVNGTFQVADAILAVAGLGFLGLGIQPPATDWGAMLSDGSNDLFAGSWWLVYPPGLAIIVVVVAINFVGDGLRDAVEVRLQRR